MTIILLPRDCFENQFTTQNFTETIEPTGLISGVFSIFIAEIITTNLLQLLDLGGNFKRHFTAPRAQTQEQMNNCMMGDDYFIAERYTVSDI